jgi:uncharacterized protein (DUF1501 family)
MSIDRRDFLRLLGAGAAFSQPAWAQAAWAQPWWRQRPGGHDRRLILVFLEGGNDGLNTVVPYADDAYHAARPKLALKKEGLLGLEDGVGLHDSLRALDVAWQAGELAVLRDVGYERPDLSHFVSRDIWHSGWRDQTKPDSGWVGRAQLTAISTGLPPAALGLAEAPLVLKNAQTNGLTITDFARFAQTPAPNLPTPAGASDGLARIARAALEAQQVAVRMADAVGKIPAGPGYPQTTLARRLQLAARLVRVEAGPPVLCVQLGGFDTHSLQPGSHAALLRQLGDALAAFHSDLGRDGVAKRCLSLVYSEFGRRVRENGSAGTDHGTAGPMFALGGGVKGGVLGAAPRLDRADGNLAVQHDFRAVFSEAVRDWLGWDAQGLFDGGFEHGRGKLGYLRG